MTSAPRAVKETRVDLLRLSGGRYAIRRTATTPGFEPTVDWWEGYGFVTFPYRRLFWTHWGAQRHYLDAIDSTNEDLGIDTIVSAPFEILEAVTWQK